MRPPLDIKRNLWSTRQSGLLAPRRMNFPIDGLALYLPLWHPELSGSPFLSKDLNAHSCTVTQATWGITGRTLDGLDDYLKILDHASFRPTQAISVGIWYRNHVSETSTRLVSLTGADIKRGWLLRTATNTALFALHDGTAYRTVTSGALTINAWHFVMGVYDKVNLSTYADGALSGTPTAETDDISYLTPSDLYIGVREGLTAAEFFDGDIGEVWIYSRALSAAEILHIYQATKWRY